MSENTVDSKIIFNKFICDQFEANKDKIIEVRTDFSTKKYLYGELCLDETIKIAKDFLFKNPEELPEDFEEISDKYFKVYLLSNIPTKKDIYLDYCEERGGSGLIAIKLYNFYYLYNQCNEFKKNKDSVGEITDATDLYEDNVKNTQIFKNGKVKAVTSDLHGSINATLFFLINSGVAKFKESEPSIIFFDMVSRKSYKNIEDFLKQNPEAKMEDFKFLKLIPNLELNENYDGKVVNCGDLIDTGFYSDEIVAIFSYLEEQEKDKNIDDKKIIRICGNHEICGLTNRTDKDTLNWNNREFTYRDILEDRIKLYYVDNDILYAHTLPLTNNIRDCIDFIEDFKIEHGEEFQEIYSAFNEEEFADFKEKLINNDGTLNKDYIKLIPKYFNPLLKLEAIWYLANPNNEHIVDEYNQELIEKVLEKYPLCSELDIRYNLLETIKKLTENRQLNNPICNCIFGHTPVRIANKPLVYQNKNILAFAIDYDQSEEKIMENIGGGYDGNTYAFYLSLEDSKMKVFLCKIDTSLETQCSKENSLLKDIEELELDVVDGMGKSPNYNYFIDDTGIILDKKKALKELEDIKKLIKDKEAKNFMSVNDYFDLKQESRDKINSEFEESIFNDSSQLTLSSD